MTYEPLTTTTTPQLNLSSFDIPDGSFIKCRVTATGVDASGSPLTIPIETNPAEVIISTADPLPTIDSLILSDLVVGNPVTATATISYDGDFAADGWSVEWGWGSQQSSEGNVTLTYSVTYEDPLFLGNDQYRTDEYTWTVRSTSGLPIEHGTFIDGTPWIIDTGDLLLVDVSPREILATIADRNGVEMTGMIGRTAINPDFGKYIPGTGWVYARAEGETNPGAAESWTEPLTGNKTNPFDFRAGNTRNPVVSKWNLHYDSSQAIDVNLLNSGIPLQEGDMVVTQTPTLESVDSRCFTASFGCLTVMSQSWTGRTDGQEYYRPPVNWDAYSTNLRQERGVMALSRVNKFYNTPIEKPSYDYDSDVQSWTENYIVGSETEPLIKRPGFIQPIHLTGDPGSAEGAGQKSVSIAPKTYPNYQSREEEGYMLSAVDPEIPVEKRKLFMDIEIQRGIDYFGKMYGTGYRLNSNGGHNPEYGPKLFYAWCVTQDSRMFDMLNFKTGNDSNGTREEIVYAPDITKYPFSPTLYHEFCGVGLCMVGNVSAGARHFGMKIESFDASSTPQSVTVLRPNTDVGSMRLRALAGEIINPNEIQYQKSDDQLINLTKMSPWDQSSNSVNNPWDYCWAGGIIRINGTTSRVIDAENVFEPYIENGDFSTDTNQDIDGFNFIRSVSLPSNSHYRTLYGMNTIGFVEGSIADTFKLAIAFDNDDWNVDAWVRNETGNIKVQGVSFSGGWSRNGRIMIHAADINPVESNIDFSLLTSVEENWVNQNPDKLKIYLQTNILSTSETYTSCDYANISEQQAGNAFLRWNTRGPANSSTEWGYQPYSYSHHAHTVSTAIITNLVGGYDTLPRWGKLRYERGQHIATQAGMNWARQTGTSYCFQNGCYLALIRKYLNDENIIPTAPVDGPDGYANPDNWPPLPDPYTIEEVILPPNGVSYFCGFQTVLNPTMMYESATALPYSKPKLLYRDPNDITKLVFDCSTFRPDSPNELNYEFFLNHNLYFMLHDTTTAVQLSEFSTTATGPDDNRFIVTYTVPPEYESVGLPTPSIILFEPIV